MNKRLICGIAGVILGAYIGTGAATVAHAEPITVKHHHANILRDFCDSVAVKHSCVISADDGVLTIRGKHGGKHVIGSADNNWRINQKLIMHFLKRHSQPCLTEDGSRCYWDAEHAGNGKGSDFYVVGDSAAVMYFN